MDDAPEITLLQLPKFKAEATELIGVDGMEDLAVRLVGNPDAGDVIRGSGRSPETAMGGEGQKGSVAPPASSAFTLGLPPVFP